MILHKTKDGKVMPISAMNDEHLENTIKFLCNKIIDAKESLNCTIKFTSLQKVLYNIDDKQLSIKAASEIRNVTSILPPYIMEAVIRGLNITEKLQQTYERTEKETYLPITKQLNAYIEDIEDIDEDDIEDLDLDIF